MYDQCKFVVDHPQTLNKQVREEAMEKLHRGGGRKNQRRAVPEDFGALAADCYDDMFAAELRRLGDTLHTAQAASLGSQPLFAALPLVGRPEDPKWVELFVLLIWTAAMPHSMAFIENHGELLLEHLTQGLGGGASCVSAFSQPHIVQWLRELAGLQHTDKVNGTVQIPDFLDLALWLCCQGSQSGEPAMWDAPQGFTKRHAEYLEFWLREELGLYLRDERTIFLDRDDRIMSLVQYDKAKVKGRIPANVKQDGYVIANFDLRKGYVVRPPLTAHRPPPTAHRPPPSPAGGDRAHFVQAQTSACGRARLWRSVGPSSAR